jgi:phenylacetate-CoA ligase
MHVQSESVYFELLNDKNEPCKTGETGKIVLTSLHSFATPLIRYEIGDYATLGPVCSCGRKSIVIDKILGRARNLMTKPNGQKIWPSGLGKLREIEYIIQFQYIQTHVDQIKLKLVLNKKIDEKEKKQITELAMNILKVPFNINLDIVEKIERGPTEKYEEFISSTIIISLLLKALII